MVLFSSIVSFSAIDFKFLKLSYGASFSVFTFSGLLQCFVFFSYYTCHFLLEFYVQLVGGCGLGYSALCHHWDFIGRLCIWVFLPHLVEVVCSAVGARIIVVKVVGIFSVPNGFCFPFSKFKLKDKGGGWFDSEMKDNSEFNEGSCGIKYKSTFKGSNLRPLKKEEGSGDLSLQDPPFSLYILAFEEGRKMSEVPWHVNEISNWGNWREGVQLTWVNCFSLAMIMEVIALKNVYLKEAFHSTP